MNYISKEMIRSLASSEHVYTRGVRYYITHAVSDVTWNEHRHQYRALVRGQGTYTVSITLNEDGSLVHTCTCPSHSQFKGACRHVVAVLLFISDYQMRMMSTDSERSPEDISAYKIIEYFRKREYEITPESCYRISCELNIPSILGASDSKAYARFYAGETRMYKIGNIKKFISDYYSGKNIVLGKKFNFIHGQCLFDKRSVSVLDYLHEIYEIQENLGKTYYSDILNSQETVLSPEMAYKLMKLFTGTEINLRVFGKLYEHVKLTDGNPDVGIKIAMKKDEISITALQEGKLTALDTAGRTFLYGNNLYLTDQDFRGVLLPFFNSLFLKKDSEVIFRGVNKNNFIENVLPEIKNTIELDIPESLSHVYVIESLKPQIRLDMETRGGRHTVRGTVTFVYGKYKVNPLEQVTVPDSKILVRDRQEEERLTRLLYELNFSVDRDSFILKDEESIFLLLTEKSRMLTDNFEVFYSKNYRAVSVKKPGAMSVRVKADTDINILELDIDYQSVPKEELKDFFRSVRLRKKYYRLKDGSFIDLFHENHQTEVIRDLLENTDKVKNSSLTFSTNRVMYIEDRLKSARHIERDAIYSNLYNDLLHPEKKEWEVPDKITAVLRPYQVEGYRWLKTLAHYRLGGILADDMGLGKTLQSIAYIVSEPGSRTIVVCPTSLAYNWQEEFEKFAPFVKTAIIEGTPEERKEKISRAYRESQVTITTYPLIRKDIKYYEDLKYDAAFIDEAQYIKNQASLSARAVKSINATHRFALTGTPVENSLSELWSVFEFIMPGFFPGYSKFCTIYEKPVVKDNDQEVLKNLRRKVGPFILRRMKKDVLRELPDKIETKLMAEMTKKQRKIYIAYLSRIQDEILEKESLTESGDKMQILSALTRLRQICCHPSTFIENYTGGSGKMDLLMEKLPPMLEAGHSVIIFSQFTSMLSIIASALDEKDIGYFYLSGATSPADRKQFVKDFNAGLVKVFLISLKAGGTGLNLTGADTVIHFDPWWNPAVEQQATDRAYRIGQHKKVQVIKLITMDSIEEKIYDIQKKKQKLSDNIIESGGVFINKLSSSEIKELFS